MGKLPKTKKKQKNKRTSFPLLQLLEATRQVVEVDVVVVFGAAAGRAAAGRATAGATAGAAAATAARQVVRRHRRQVGQVGQVEIGRRRTHLRPGQRLGLAAHLRTVQPATIQTHQKKKKIQSPSSNRVRSIVVTTLSSLPLTLLYFTLLYFTLLTAYTSLLTIYYLLFTTYLLLLLTYYLFYLLSLLLPVFLHYTTYNYLLLTYYSPLTYYFYLLIYYLLTLLTFTYFFLLPCFRLKKGSSA